MLPRVNTETIETLREPRFRTLVDPSFVIGDNLDDDICIDPIRILEGPDPRPRLRVDFARDAGTTGNDPGAQRALDALREAAVETQVVVYLEAGEMLVLDNNYAVHGRTPFVPRYDGGDRWLLRSFVTRDLGRSEGVRPGNERIVQPGYTTEKGDGSARCGKRVEPLDHPLRT